MDALFSKAKAFVTETAAGLGLQESYEPDLELEKWTQNIDKMDAMAQTIRKRFVAYAAAMVDVVRPSFPTLSLFSVIRLRTVFLLCVPFGRRDQSERPVSSLVMC